MNIPKGLKKRKDPKAVFAVMLIKAAIGSVKPPLFEKRSAGEMLFAGFEVPLFNQMKKMMPDQPIPDKFGLLADVSINLPLSVYKVL